MFRDFVLIGNEDIGVDYYLAGNVALPQDWIPFDFYDNFSGMDPEGKCHEISGLNISELPYGGLFSRIGRCRIDNLTVSGRIEASLWKTARETYTLR